MNVIVIGGGASGLMAALTAARNGHAVTLLERQSRVGRKLLSTGNGRCNLTNLHVAPVHYHGLSPDFVRPALDAFDTGAALAFFHGLGLLTVAEDSGRVYPYSDQAGSVLDVLRFAADAAGVITRIMVIRRKGVEYFNNVFIKKFDNYTTGGLLLTLIILFSFQGETILNNPLHIALIAVPLVLQTVLIFFVAYGWAKWWKLPHDVAAPAGMIGASNFFELAVAVAISLFGLQSGAALATVVGVLVEVPVMLMLVRIANNTRNWFPASK